MATHHGRPGGRLLEVLLALGLVVLYLGLFSGFVELVSYDFGLWGNGRDYHRDFDAILFKAVVFFSLCAAAGVLAFLWGLLLRYYRHDAHTLRPLSEDKPTTSGDGREKNEG